MMNWYSHVHWDLALIGILAVAASVSLLALALNGYGASVGVILVVCAIEALLYWLGRTQSPPRPPKPPRFIPFQEPVTGAH